MRELLDWVKALEEGKLVTLILFNFYGLLAWLLNLFIHLNFYLQII